MAEGRALRGSLGGAAFTSALPSVFGGLAVTTVETADTPDTMSSEVGEYRSVCEHEATRPAPHVMSGFVFCAAHREATARSCRRAPLLCALPNVPSAFRALNPPRAPIALPGVRRTERWRPPVLPAFSLQTSAPGVGEPTCFFDVPRCCGEGDASFLRPEPGARASAGPSSRRKAVKVVDAISISGRCYRSVALSP